MSTILDALKKSERERTLVRGLGFGDAGRRVAERHDWLPWIVGAIALVVLATLVAAFVLRDRFMSTQTADAVAVEPAVSTNLSVDKPVSPLPVVSSVNKSPAELPALQEMAVAAPPPATPLLPPDGEAKLLSAMPPEFQQSVPPMTVNIHVYAPDEGQRILYINNHQYYRGDEIPGGVMVEEIVPDGVVLQFAGQRFRLPRPS